MIVQIALLVLSSVNHLEGKEKGDINDQLDSLYYLAYDSSLANPRFAKSVAREYIKRSREAGITAQEAYAHGILGDIHYWHYEMDSAEVHLQKSLDHFRQIHDTENIVNSNLELADVYALQSDYDKAIDLYFNGLNLGRKMRYYYYEAWALQSIAFIFEEQDNYRTMMDYLRKAQPAIDSAKYSSYLRHHSNQLTGWYELKYGSPDKALRLAQITIDSVKNQNEGSWLIDLYCLKANALRALNKNDSIKPLNRRIKNLLLSIKDPYTQSLYSGELSKLLLTNNAIDSADKYSKSAIKIANSLDNPYLKKMAYQARAEYYKTVENYDSAYHYHELYHAMSMDLNQRGVESLFLEKQNAVESLNNKLLKRENNEIKNDLRQSRNLAYLFALLVVVFISAGIIIYSLSRKLRTYNKRLLAKNKQLHQSQLELEKLNRTKDRLFSVLAHDLKEPFTQLLGIMEMQSSQVLDEQSRQSLIAKSYQTAKSMSGVVQNLLLWSRNQLKGIKTELEPISLPLLFSDLKNELSNLTEQKNLTLVSRIPSDFIVESDKAQLKIILRNLLVNAFKYSHSGKSVTIEAGEGDEGKYIAIKDQGVGMQQHTLEQLRSGDPSNQSEEGTASEKGTGLGMLIVRDFLREQNARLEIDSVYQKGSTFTIYFDK